MSEADDEWFAIEYLPPGRCRVRLEWSARQFVAARMVDPRTRKLGWCLPPREGWEIEWLPAYGLSEHGPTAWQPEDPGKYIWPGNVKPEPLRPAGGRMWSERLRFKAVEDALSGRYGVNAAAAELSDMSESDMAAAMQRERDFLSDRRDGADAGRRGCVSAPEAPEQQWWLTERITYSAAGSISKREAEARLMRAILTERWVRVEKPRCNTFAGVLAGMIRPEPLPPHELAAQDPAPVRWEPNGQDQDDMLVALSWRAALAAAHRDVLSALAELPPKGWRAIGRSLGVSYETARQQHAAALAALHDVANGLVTDAAQAAAARLAAVRAGNRRAKRT